MFFSNLFKFGTCPSEIVWVGIWDPLKIDEKNSLNHQ